MNTSMTRFVLAAAVAVLCSIGCNSVPGDRAFSSDDSSETAAPTGEVEQAVTGCEVDCSNGSKLLCNVTPCRVVDPTTLDCQGTVSHCPVCVPKTCADRRAECGSVSDGCGHTLNCGTCDDGVCLGTHVCGCPGGTQDCGDGSCRHTC